VSGQLHASAALPPRKMSSVSLDRRLGGLDKVERRKLLPLTGLKLRPLGRRYNDCATPASLELGPLAESNGHCNKISASVKSKEFLLEKGLL
jgi:hypothetical protein